MRNFLLILFAFCSTSLAFAQNKIVVKGKVLDEDKYEVIGGTVLEKGTSNGTITDIDGNYTISVSPKAELVFSYVGMQSKTEKVNNRSEINVTLKADAIALDEVVAIGYGTVRRGELTSSISSVMGKEIAELPVNDALQAISGRIAGLQVVQSSGAPGAATEVKIRGGISITQSNEPLYIVDGFPSPDGLTGIEPSDIESIDVLKDASSAAIYGAAGANGVILVTTKKGGEGRANIIFDTYVGFKKLSKRLDVLSPEDFVKLEYERSLLGSADDMQRFVNIYGGGYNSELSSLTNMQNSWYDIPHYYRNRKGIDWQDEVFEGTTPMTQNYKVGISGGTKDTNYNANYSFTNDGGIMANSGLKRNNIRLTFGHKMTEKMRFNMSASFVEDKVEGVGSLQVAGKLSALRNIVQYRPVISRDGNDRDLITMSEDPYLESDMGEAIINPITAVKEEERLRKNQVMNFNSSLSYEIIKNLTYQIQGSLRRRNFSNDAFFHSKSRQANRAGAPYAMVSNGTDNSWSYTNTLSYRLNLPKKHNFNFLIGQEEKYRKFTSSNSSIINFPDENFGLNDLGLGTVASVPVTTMEGERDLSFFGRVNYNFKGRYLATATYRIDGSSKFGKNHKWGHFPSLSLAWRTIDEEFMRKLPVFSDLKLRVGVGMAGNNNISRYNSMSRLGSVIVPGNGEEVIGMAPVQLANPNLKWETDISASFGVEMGFFNQRLQVTIDLYKNIAKDLLLERQIPLASGFGTVLQNIGRTENQGVEVAINTHNIEVKNFSWKTSLNLSVNDNKVKKLAYVDEMPYRSSWASGEFKVYDYLLQVGRPLGQIWGYKVDGVYQVDDFDYDSTTGKYTLKDGQSTNTLDKDAAPGYWKYTDVNGDGQVDENDITVIGKVNPKLYGGMNNSFQIKDFDLSFMLNYSVGGKVYNANKLYFSKLNARNNNALANVENHFTYVNEQGDNVFNNPEELARINEGASWASLPGTNTFRLNSKFIESSSFLRLTNITLGYSMPNSIISKLGISKFRVYASANNLFTITGYSGYDPEVNTRPNGGLTPGIDWGAYPRATSYIFGANITF